jgi:hypothetical protein
MLFQAPETPHAWWWLFPTITVIGGVAGWLSGSFFSKRGEIAAIQSQIDKVVAQNERLVRSSEAIKAELSDKSFSKQRHWDIKRDAALEIMRMQGTLYETIGHLWQARDIHYRAELQNIKKDEEAALASYNATLKVLNPIMTSFWQLEEVARLVFSASIYEKMETLKDIVNELLTEIAVYGERKVDKLFDAVIAQKSILAEAIRAELEM